MFDGSISGGLLFKSVGWCLSEAVCNTVNAG